jgi:hypothetical protein
MTALTDDRNITRRSKMREKRRITSKWPQAHISPLSNTKSMTQQVFSPQHYATKEKNCYGSSLPMQLMVETVDRETTESSFLCDSKSIKLPQYMERISKHYLVKEHQREYIAGYKLAAATLDHWCH